MENYFVEKKYAFDKPIHKIDFINYRPNSLALINNNNSNISISLPRQDAYNCLESSYISVDFEALKQDDTRYADDDQINLINFGPVALFSEVKLTTSSGKHLEKVSSLHIISLMHKLSTSQQQASELMN